MEIRPEVVFHLAAQADVGTSVEQPELDAEVNIVGTMSVLEAARPHGAQVVFASTGGAIYGECDRPAREDDPRGPLSPYGTSKLAAEEYLATWNRLYGTSMSSLRFANVYGPRQAPKLEGGVVAIFLDLLRAGEGIDDLRRRRADARLRLRRRRRRGGARRGRAGRRRLQRRHRHRDVRERALRGVPRGRGRGGRGRARAGAAGDVRRSVLDVSRWPERELGWRPQTALEEGLRDCTWG